MLDAVRRWPPAVQLAVILFVALALRFALTPLYANVDGAVPDENYWKQWMQLIDEHGVLHILRAEYGVNYVGYNWVLWLLSMVYGVIGGPYTNTTPSLHILVKMSPVLADLALTAATYWATRKLVRAESASADRARTTSALPMLAAAVVALHPVIIYDSAVWAQTDGMIATAMLGAIVLVATGNPLLAGMAWGLGFGVKPQPIIIAPLLAVIAYQRGSYRDVLRLCAGVALPLLVIWAPWVLAGYADRIAGIYKWNFTEDLRRLSAAAWNIWWFFDVAGDPQPTDRIAGIPLLTYRIVGMALAATAGLIALAYAWGRPTPSGALVAGAYLAFAFYVLPINAHDRYGYPALVLLLPVAVTERRWLPFYVALSTTTFLNMFFAAPPVESWSRWLDSPLGLAVAATNVALFTYFTALIAPGAADAITAIRAQGVRNLLTPGRAHWSAETTPAG